jgi:hypothetical protein
VTAAGVRISDAEAPYLVVIALGGRIRVPVCPNGESLGIPLDP